MLTGLQSTFLNNDPIEQKFRELGKRSEGVIIAYLMGHDPDPKAFVANATSLVEGGADILEVGIPFSDPVADGPVIQAASIRALSGGATPQKILDTVGELASQLKIPIVTLTYYGAEKVVPKYNVMGVAKAALEATVRYMANDLGPKGIRVNAISAGPIKTLAARGISQLGEMLKAHAERAPLKRNVDPAEVGGTAVFLLSEAGSGITGETLYVDCGYNIMGF